MRGLAGINLIRLQGISIRADANTRILPREEWYWILEFLGNGPQQGVSDATASDMAALARRPLHETARALTDWVLSVKVDELLACYAPSQHMPKEVYNEALDRLKRASKVAKRAGSALDEGDVLEILRAVVAELAQP